MRLWYLITDVINNILFFLNTVSGNLKHLSILRHLHIEKNLKILGIVFETQTSAQLRVAVTSIHVQMKVQLK